MAQLNQFGKPKWQNRYFPPAINFGTGACVAIAATDIESYGPFVRLHIENKAIAKLQIALNGAVLGDNSIYGETADFFIAPSNGILDLNPKSSGDADYLYWQVAIKNLDGAVNTVLGDIAVVVSNW